MLSQEQIDKTKELLNSGMTMRQIAKHIGIGRTSVAKIKSGKITTSHIPHHAWHGEEPLWTTDVGRCPTCGGKVFLPCYQCRVERGEVLTC